MRKRSLSVRQNLLLIWKLAILLSFIFLVFALVRIHFYYDDRSPDDDDGDVFQGNPSLAFMFLVRRDLPLDFLWQTFYQNVDAANYSIYIHSEPGFVFDETTTRSSFFYGRHLSNSIKVGWGESSMIEAERLLLRAALQNPANQRFILLSDSCVPLYNFSYIYNYLMGSSKSFVDSFLDMKEGRYNPRMSSVIPMRKWRKGSQWIALVRSHAKVVAYDNVVFPVFKKLCKRRPPLDVSKGKQNLKLQRQHNCIPDEHYVQTLLAMNDLEGELERRTVTYTLWIQSATNMETRSWHPVTYNYASANPQQIKRIKDINHVYYETEHRTEWCKSNSISVPCFLFARKFSRDGAMRLLTQGSFDSSALSHTSP
ncbi:putative glycosyl transferase, family 14 [Helianthus annuus]|uniref:Glycosyl transferase, family 14 n=2 Tax=Helianthus annuus TaxID=4232 RepID=A0A251UL37_HELAN|nr:glycosyltransferase BC10 isoform X1 [Helianthus annuus]KAF5804091.1 putative glycosyl transferase, family 14 [Helianthus annuus]KAJ0583042.1 putative glycosyl transferase, family 14 [Helianthus annuus]KAJ0917161.1 putative glycosyl transferase, family 14 [Helianthus annuus]